MEIIIKGESTIAGECEKINNYGYKNWFIFLLVETGFTHSNQDEPVEYEIISINLYDDHKYYSENCKVVFKVHGQVYNLYSILRHQSEYIRYREHHIEKQLQEKDNE